MTSSLRSAPVATARLVIRRATAASWWTCRRCAASRSIRRRVSRGSNGGTLLGELDIAAQAHGLVCPTGVIGHTGVAGLTLGGGVGRLQRRFGLTIDSLRAVELVTADGRFVRASETEEPDLFWGIRGAGWNFGIVTAFEFGLHPFGPELHRGVRVYPASAAREVWEVVRRLRGHRTRGGLGDLRHRAGRGGRGRRHTARQARIPSSSSRSTTAASRTRSSTTPPACAADRSRSRSVAAASRSWRSRPRTTSPSPAAGARSSRACTRTPSGPRRSTRMVEHVAAGLCRWVVLHHRCRAERSRGSTRTRRPSPGARRASTSAPTPAGTTPRTTIASAPGSARRWRWSSQTRSRAATPTRTPTPGPMRRGVIYGDAKVARLAALKQMWDPDNVFRRNHNIEPAAT